MKIGAPVSPALAAARVLDDRGAPLLLAERWRERDAVIVFIRHFACIGCSEHLSELLPRVAELDALGAPVVIVGSGSALQLVAFVERNGLQSHPVTTYTDPTLAAYTAAGFHRSKLGVLGPRAVWQLFRALGRGHTGGAPEGDVYQQGGTLYIGASGDVLYYHRAASLGDHAPSVDLVELALRRRGRELP
jgi:hypothetical protein